MSRNKILFLGTGTSVGIPMIGCDCEVCSSTNFRDQRLRTSAFVSYHGKNILIDIGPDFRLQMLNNKISQSMPSSLLILIEIILEALMIFAR